MERWMYRWMGRLVERRNNIHAKGVWVTLCLLSCTVLMATEAGLSSHPMTLCINRLLLQAETNFLKKKFIGSKTIASYQDVL